MAKRRELSTADRKRVEKLAALVDDLKAGKYYPITRLTSIKSLCKERVVACRFTAWLASLAAQKIAGRKRPAHIARTKWDEIRKLAAVGFAALHGCKSNDLLQEVLRQVRGVQNEFERHHWANVRVIQSRELLQIERTLESRLDTFDAPHIAYKPPDAMPIGTTPDTEPA